MLTTSHNRIIKVLLKVEYLCEMSSGIEILINIFLEAAIF